MSATRPASPRSSSRRSSSSTLSRVTAITAIWSLPSSSGRYIRTLPSFGTSTVLRLRNASPAGSPRPARGRRPSGFGPAAAPGAPVRSPEGGWSLPPPDPGHLFREERGDQLRRHLVGPVQQHTQQPFAESLRPVHPGPVRLVLTVRHRCPLPFLPGHGEVVGVAGRVHAGFAGWPNAPASSHRGRRGAVPAGNGAGCLQHPDHVSQIPRATGGRVRGAPTTPAYTHRGRPSWPVARESVPTRFHAMSGAHFGHPVFRGSRATGGRAMRSIAQGRCRRRCVHLLSFGRVSLPRGIAAGP